MAIFGNTAIEATDLDNTTQRAVMAAWTAGIGFQLDSVTIYVASGTPDVRICVITNDDADPDAGSTATVLEDLGIVSCSVGWNTLPSSTNPAIGNPGFLGIAFKTNDAATFKRSDDAGFWGKARFKVASTDETVAWADADFDSGWSESDLKDTSIYLTYSAVGGGATGSIFRHPSPTLDGPAVQVGDGTVVARNLYVPSGEYATPFWVRPDGDNNRTQRVDSLPAQLVLRCGQIEVLSSAPV